MLNLDCTLESPGELYKLLIPGPHLQSYSIIGSGTQPGPLKRFPDDSHGQPRLKTTVFV